MMKSIFHILTLVALHYAFAIKGAAGAETHDHDHGHEGHGHKCACEAEEFGFTIDCSDQAVMLAALSELQTLGCATDCSSEACVLNFYIVQSHHDYCPETEVPTEIEDGFHDYDVACEACEISRQIVDGAPDCPVANCDNNSGNEAYLAAIEAGCAIDCSSETCRSNFFTLRSVHDTCPHDVLSQEAEEGIHDLEGACVDQVCNSGMDDALVCDEHQDEDDATMIRDGRFCALVTLTAALWTAHG